MHRAHLVLGVLAVGVRPLPGAGPLDRRARLLVAPVDRASARGRQLAPREQAELDRRPRRPRRRRADRRLEHPGLLRIHPDARQVAELALAGPHRRRRVALRELDRVEALSDRTLHVLRRDVLAHADEALALALVRRLGRDAREPLAGDAPDGLDPVRKLGRHEDAERVVELHARARLGEQRVRRLPAAATRRAGRSRSSRRRGRAAGRDPCRPAPRARAAGRHGGRPPSRPPSRPPRARPRSRASRRPSRARSRARPA